MAKGYTTRKLEVFAIHAENEGKHISYIQLFSMISNQPPTKRICIQEEKILALRSIILKNNLVNLIVYEGTKGQNPLIFNIQNDRERIQKLSSGEFVATKTYALIDTDSRTAIIEYNHKGAKAVDINELLMEILRKKDQYQNIQLETNPVVDENFIKAIDGFSRIRIATLKVARPNPGWTDHENNLTNLAEESDAHTVEISLTASRSKTLNFRNGIVSYIKDLSRRGLSIFKGASIIGTRENEQAETKISLANHIKHQKVNVKMTPDGHVDEHDITSKLTAFHSSMKKKVGK